MMTMRLMVSSIPRAVSSCWFARMEKGSRRYIIVISIASVLPGAKQSASWKEISATSERQPLRLVKRGGSRCRQEADQRASRYGLLGIRCDPGGKGGDVLQLRRQHADDVDAGIGHQLGYLLQGDLGFAARYQHTDASVRSAGRKFRLGGDLIADAKLFE